MNLWISGFDLFGVHITFYGMLIAIGFMAAFFVATKLAKTASYPESLPYNLLLLIFPLAIIGARIYYVIFSGTSWTFWEIFEVWNGGLAVYGGIIACVIGILVYALITKKNFFTLTDLAAPCLILGQAIGRWGNFLNQEAYGIAIANPAFHWFPFGVLIEADGLWHYATFFYESMWCIIGFVILLILFKKHRSVGLCTSFYLAFYGLGRFFIEGLRTDSLYLWNSGIRVSQALSVLLFLVGIVGIILSLTFEKRKKLM